jgi:hypothetical protein
MRVFKGRQEKSGIHLIERVALGEEKRCIRVAMEKVTGEMSMMKWQTLI